MIDELLLLSGNDIPFPEAKLIIHPPRLKEIAYITEKVFWPGCQLFKIDKNILTEKDKVNLSNQSNFNIIMSMISQKNIESYQARVNIFSILSLMFPSYQIRLESQAIILQHQQNEQIHKIDNNNFEAFKDLFIEIFCLNDVSKEYNPSGQLAKKIIDKIKKGQEKKAKLAPDKNQKISIFSRYISILTVGQNKNMNDFMDYTVYQLLDQFNRYVLKLHYDTWQKYRIAGATGMEDPQDWFKDIHTFDAHNEKDSWLQ